MSRPRFLFPAALTLHKFCILKKEERNYLCSVLRLREGDELDLFDGRGWEGRGVIELPAEGMTGIRVSAAWAGESPNYRLTLCQALPKGDKMDLIVQKATELGVARIIPMMTARTVSRPRGNHAIAKVERWRRIAQAASRQCGRITVPHIEPIREWGTFLDLDPAAGELRLVLWEDGGEEVREVLRTGMPDRSTGSWVVVGPEGGFEAEEIAALRQRGFVTVQLGRHILRTETAAMAICTLLQYELGDFFTKGKETA